MRTAIGMVLLVLGLTGPVLFARWQLSGQRNFRIVEPGVLYRSGQMNETGLKRAVHDHGIRTVISLRESSESGAIQMKREEEFCSREGVNLIALPVRGWDTRDGETEPPAMDNIRRLLEVMRERRNHPVLIHCYAGIHRTGIYCAVMRMERDGWDLDRVIAEMHACGYGEVETHPDVMGFLTGYRAKR